MAVPEHPSTPAPQHQRIMVAPATSRKATGSGKDVKQRVNMYMNKLSDRDTEAMAASELESMARALPSGSLPSFLSAISDTRPSDKTPLRRHCLRLLSLLSRTQPPQSISPFLPRMVSAVLRRIRDPDSSVRSACVDAVRDMCRSSHCRGGGGGGGACSVFVSVFLKPLSESLLLEQDHNAQTGSAMCLAAAVDEVSAAADGDRGARGHDLAQHLHRLVPRLVKLAKSNGFKAKPALVSLLGSIVAAGGASTPALMGILVPCLADFLASEDWAARKAAAEALTRVAALPDRRLLAGFKSSYFSSFHARRFDKVKIVRESMNQMLEAWKDVPDALEDEDGHGGNTLPSQSPSGYVKTENMSDGSTLAGTGKSSSERSTSPFKVKKNRSPVNISTPTDALATPARRLTLPRADKKVNDPLFLKFDQKKPSDCKIEIAIPHVPPSTVISKDGVQNGKEREGRSLEQCKNQESCGSKLAKRLVFENSEERIDKFMGLKSASCVIPFQEQGIPDQTVESDEFSAEKKENDLSVIRKQLVQIENQQSSIVDLLQRFIGDAENGIRSLETRVHGLEMALDELSHDLVVSSGRMSKTDPTVNCCRIPGAEFLSSKFWRRTEGRYSSKFSISTNLPLVKVHNSGHDDRASSLKQGEQTFGHQAGFVVNPLAEDNPQSRGISAVSSKRMLQSMMDEPGSRQSHNSSMIDATATIITTANSTTRGNL
uniref:Microtubule-associated protein TORTIFOLIA1 n=1 Tax=Anthurium amnicola TaxID=1678845 RepID=A0A1D1YZH6_9ARAE